MSDEFPGSQLPQNQAYIPGTPEWIARRAAEREALEADLGIGPPGPEGPAGPEGPRATYYQGAWDTSVDYHARDSVTYNHALWLSMQAHKSVTPGSNPAVWQMLIEGVAGPQGAPGTPAPVRRYWQVFGDGAGDGTNSTTTFSTSKSPVFTVPATGWYRISAEINAFPDANGSTFEVSLMADATPLRTRRATGNSGWYTPMSILIAAQIGAGAKLAIGYRSIVAGRTVTLVNSGGVVPGVAPLLEVSETSAPSS